MTLKDMTNATFSPVSADGVSLSGSQDGPIQDEMFGQEAHPVSPSAPQDNAKVLPTLATSGPSTSVSSPSAVLQRSLESKLQQRLATGGSTLFSLTWKAKDTPARRPFFQLVASARRTSANDFGSWPTPQHSDVTGGGQAKRATNPDRSNDLNDFAMLASWPTPMAGNPGTENYNAAGNTDSSRQTRALMGVGLAGVDRSSWPTASASDTRTYSKESIATYAQGGTVGGHGLDLNAATQLAHGLTSNGSPAQTEKPGQLNPEFSLWLMGYPAEWAYSGAQAMQSSRKSRRK
jgi:hypothetical protein